MVLVSGAWPGQGEGLAYAVGEVDDQVADLDFPALDFAVQPASVRLAALHNGLGGGGGKRTIW